VLGNAGKIKTRLASHAHSIAAPPARSCQPKPCPRIVPTAQPPTGIVPDTFSSGTRARRGGGGVPARWHTDGAMDQCSRPRGAATGSLKNSGAMTSRSGM
jgi:hypothetical protein